jgi:hypothetical protein
MSNPSLHPALADVLRQDRDTLNRRFALRQRAGARIDGVAFNDHLRTTVNELVGRVAARHPQCVRVVVNALFDVSLDLFAAGLLGPQTKHPHVSTAWRQILPQAVPLLARDPARVAGSLSNAVDHLASHTAARPSEWIDWVAKLSPHVDSLPQWLDVGKVLAWRAGLVQYRPAALGLLRAMPWKLAVRCFDRADDVAESDWRQCLDRLDADRWYSPFHDDPRTLRIVRIAGGFRGFAGPCLRPPTVTTDGDRLIVKDRDEAWQLLADAFGTYWFRTAGVPATPKAAKDAAKIFVDARGRVTWQDASDVIAELAEPSSFASDGQTLAVTLPTSHHVFLLARAAN